MRKGTIIIVKYRDKLDKSAKQPIITSIIAFIIKANKAAKQPI